MEVNSFLSCSLNEGYKHGCSWQVIHQSDNYLYVTAEQAEWLMKEHFKNQATIEKIYDDEISRQRMALEEKLARRRALATEHVRTDMI